MRTFRCKTPILIGAGTVLVLCLVPAPAPLKASERHTGASAVGRNHSGPGDQSDRVAALKALQLALSELGDGATLVWRRPERGLVGRIRPLSAFRDDKGRVCRTVAYSLALGTYQRDIEAVACREHDGSWSLSG